MFPTPTRDLPSLLLSSLKIGSIELAFLLFYHRCLSHMTWTVSEAPLAYAGIIYGRGDASKPDGLTIR